MIIGVGSSFISNEFCKAANTGSAETAVICSAHRLTLFPVRIGVIRPGLYRICTLILAIPLSLIAVKGRAQLATAEIDGTVHDQTAALVPGATVTATQVDTGVVTTTTANGEGIFVFSTLPVGSYVINVNAPGFEAYRQTGVTLTVGQHLSLSIGLTVGRADQVVTVPLRRAIGAAPLPCLYLNVKRTN